jgi:DNA-binding PadR family transcriptional regulator
MNERTKSKGRKVGSSHKLTTADLVVLSLLWERPMHGYELLSEYQRQEVVDWASISKAQLYYALNKLSTLGLLRGSVEEGGPRERTVYRPTTLGRAALTKGLKKDAWAKSRVAQPFTTWLGLSIHASPDCERKLLRARLGFLEKEIEKEKHSAEYLSTQTDPRALRGADIVRLTLRQLQVEREWIVELLTKQTRGS